VSGDKLTKYILYAVVLLVCALILTRRAWPEETATFEEIQSRAEAGEQYALTMTAWAYYLGSDVESDLNKALFWAEKAAKSGDDWGEYILANVLRDMGGVENERRAWDLLESLNKSGNIKAATALYRGESTRAGLMEGEYLRIKDISLPAELIIGQPFVVDLLIETKLRRVTPIQFNIVSTDRTKPHPRVHKDKRRLESETLGAATVELFPGESLRVVRVFCWPLSQADMNSSRQISLWATADSDYSSRYPVLHVSKVKSYAVSVQQSSPQYKVDPGLIRMSGNFTQANGNGVFAQIGESVTAAINPSIAAKDIRWYQVIPDFTSYYRNAEWPDRNNAYKYLGPDTLLYQRVELPEFRGKSQVQLAGRDGVQNAFTRFPLQTWGNVSEVVNYSSQEGTYWFQAEVLTKDGKWIKSPGIEEADQWGIPVTANRLTLISDDSFLGYFKGFFNVPAVFGSNPVQAGNYRGTDCADSVNAAYHALNRRSIERDINVQHLVDDWDKVVVATLKDDGEVRPKLRWGEDIQPGMIVAYKYSPKFRHAHMAVLVRDANGNGVLDSEDETLETGPFPFMRSVLGNYGHDVTLSFIRQP